MWISTYDGALVNLDRVEQIDMLDDQRSVIARYPSTFDANPVIELYIGDDAPAVMSKLREGAYLDLRLTPAAARID